MHPVGDLRGLQSVTFLDGFRRRARVAQNRGQIPVILYFGDMDPSGYQMLEAIKQTLEDEMDLWGVEYHRVALTPDQIMDYELPHDPQAVKITDKRYRKYVQRFGDLAVELDALHPKVLRKLAVEPIEGHVDMSLFHEQIEVEQLEQERLASLKQNGGIRLTPVPLYLGFYYWRISSSEILSHNGRNTDGLLDHSIEELIS